MYTVKNETTKELIFRTNVLKPGDQLPIVNNVFDTNYIKNQELGTVEIASEYGDHSAKIFGLLTVEPKNGKDGCIFCIGEKNQK